MNLALALQAHFLWNGVVLIFIYPKSAALSGGTAHMPRGSSHVSPCLRLRRHVLVSAQMPTNSVVATLLYDAHHPCFCIVLHVG